MANKQPVVHFEMPAEDKGRMCHFYQQAFGWQTNMLGPEMGDYVLVSTTETDENGHPKKPGMINGGFFQKKSDSAQHPSIVICVDDVDEAIKKVRAEGGQLIDGPMEIPGYGIYAAFYDTEGNRVGMMQPFTQM